MSLAPLLNTSKLPDRLLGKTTFLTSVNGSFKVLLEYEEFNCVDFWS